MALIRVTTETLRNKAEELRQLNSNLNTEISGLRESEARLSGMWEGEAKEAFHKQFLMDAEKFEAFYKGINQYIQRLEETATSYDKAEAANVSTANTRNS